MHSGQFIFNYIWWGNYIITLFRPISVLYRSGLTCNYLFFAPKCLKTHRYVLQKSYEAYKVRWKYCSTAFCFSTSSKAYQKTAKWPYTLHISKRNSTVIDNFMVHWSHPLLEGIIKFIFYGIFCLGLFDPSMLHTRPRQNMLWNINFIRTYIVNFEEIDTPIIILSCTCKIFWK